MKILHCTLLAGFLFLSCCAKENKKEENIEEIQESEIAAPGFSEVEDASQYVSNDSVVVSWISRLEELTKNDNRFEIEKELTENRHNKKQIDTIKTFSYKDSEIIIYSTEGLYAAWIAEINDLELALSEKVKVGMQKDKLEEFLGTTITNDSIKVGASMKTNVFHFYLQNDELESIKFEGYVD